MKKIFLTIAAALVLLYNGCSDSDKSTGVPATAETIIGNWVMNTFVINATANLIVISPEFETSETVDTTGTLPPDGMSMDVRADSTYTLITSEEVDTMIINLFSLPISPSKKKSAKTVMLVESGTWTLENGILTTISDADEPDTSQIVATLDGDGGNFLITRNISQSDDNFSLSVVVKINATGAKSGI